MCSITHKPCSQEMQTTIANLFLDGASVNHIVFLLDYDYGINCVLEMLRDEIEDQRRDC